MSSNSVKATKRDHDQTPDDSSRILIVDDHPLVRKGLVDLIGDEKDLEVCCEAGTVSEALRLVNDDQPDLAIIDIALDGESGLELIKQIKSLHPDVSMLVCSAHDESLYAERCLQAGAKGYINKKVMMDEVINAIRRVIAGEVYLSPAMSTKVIARMAFGKSDTPPSLVDALSDRELEVFQLIGQGMTTTEIAEQIHLSSKTVETYRQHIKRKLQLKNATELVRTATAWTIENL